MNNKNKKEVQEAYNTHGAKLINAHGLLSNSNNKTKIVPPKTVIYFLGRPGYCLHIPTTLGVQNEYFTSKEKLESYMYRSGNKNNITYVSNSQSKVKVPGDSYINLDLKIEPDKEYPTMGYIKKLPTKPSNQFLTYKNIVPIAPGWHRLSDLIKPGGVYIVSSCQQIPSNTRNRFNESPYGKAQVPRGTAWSNLITKEKFKPHKKGHLMRKRVSLEPKKKIVNATRKIYPPSIIKKLREEMIKGKNFLETVQKIGARANLPVRRPGTYNQLRKLSTVRALPSNQVIKTRSSMVYKKR